MLAWPGGGQTSAVSPTDKRRTEVSRSLFETFALTGLVCALCVLLVIQFESNKLCFVPLGSPAWPGVPRALGNEYNSVRVH